MLRETLVLEKIWIKGYIAGPPHFKCRNPAGPSLTEENPPLGCNSGHIRTLGRQPHGFRNVQKNSNYQFFSPAACEMHHKERCLLKYIVVPKNLT